MRIPAAIAAASLTLAPATPVEQLLDSVSETHTTSITAINSAETDDEIRDVLIQWRKELITAADELADLREEAAADGLSKQEKATFDEADAAIKRERAGVRELRAELLPEDAPVVVPAPIEVDHPETPEPVRAASVETPEPVRTFSPQVPEPQRLAAIRTFQTEARVPFPPEPVRAWAPQARGVIPRHPQLPPLQPLKPVDINRFAQPRDTPMPNRAPLKPITVDRPPLKPIVVEPAPRVPLTSAPAPQPVIVPKAPAPKPLKQITIEPVVKYYDRSR